MKFTFFITSLFCGTLAFAQPQKVVADKIVAIVGDKPILKSDVVNAIADAQRRGESVPADAECLFIVQTLAQKALTLQAEKDSLPLSDEEIEAEMENRIRYYISA